jgi:lipoate-protein ligase A
MMPEDPPVLLWTRSDRPHLSIGASQYAAADLDLARCEALGIPVIQRPLGGGTVWVDEEQECFFFILPRQRVPGGHQGLFDRCLDLVACWFAGMGMPVRRVGGQDLWLGSRKILGSGAASQGDALVFGASVLRHFPVRAFADCIRAPSDGFRDWLAEALAEGMSDWRSQGIDPEAEILQAGLRETCETQAGWNFRGWSPDLRTHEAMAEARAELSEPLDLSAGRRHVPGGIRINGLRYLLEQDLEGGWLRVLLDDGIIRRVASANPAIHAALQACLGEPAHAGRLRAILGETLTEAQASDLATRLELMHASIPA